MLIERSGKFGPSNFTVFNILSSRKVTDLSNSGTGFENKINIFPPQMQSYLIISFLSDMSSNILNQYAQKRKDFVTM